MLNGSPNDATSAKNAAEIAQAVAGWASEGEAALKRQCKLLEAVAVAAGPQADLWPLLDKLQKAHLAMQDLRQRGNAEQAPGPHFVARSSQAIADVKDLAEEIKEIDAAVLAVDLSSHAEAIGAIASRCPQIEDGHRDVLLRSLNWSS